MTQVRTNELWRLQTLHEFADEITKTMHRITAVQHGTITAPDGWDAIAAYNDRCDPDDHHHVDPHRGCILR